MTRSKPTIALSRREALGLAVQAGGGLVAMSLLAACGGGATASPTAAAPAAITAPAAPKPTTPPATGAPTAAPTTAAANPTTAPAAAGATPAATKPPVAIKGTKLTFWYNYTGNNEKAMSAVMDKFNAAQSNATVVGESKKSYDDLYKANLAALTAGDPPSFSIAYENQVSVYMKNNAVVPFDDYINMAGEGLSADDKADIFPAFLDLGKFSQFSNKQLTFPAGKSLEIMWYNADAIKKAGFDKAPDTWDDFKTQVAKVATADMAGYVIKPDASRFATWVFSRGADVISADGSKITLNTPEALAGLQLILDLNKAKQFKLVSPTGFDDENIFAAQKAAFWQESTSARGFIDGAIKSQNGQPFNWQALVMPQGSAANKHASNLYGGNFTIFKTKPEQQLGAWQYIKFFAQKENTVAWALATGYMPLRKSASDTPDYKKFLDENPRNGVAFNNLGNPNKGEPKVPAWQQVRDIVQAMIQDVVNNGTDPKDALSAADKKANVAMQQS
jgi:ABC-type glycerol-3-phosphate transport system substrate-binding protein